MKIMKENGDCNEMQRGKQENGGTEERKWENIAKC